MNTNSTKSTSVTQIKVESLASARIAQSEIANSLRAKFGAECVIETSEIKRKISESSGLAYSAEAYLAVKIDLTKTSAAKRWIAGANAALAKGIDADDVRITGGKPNQWDRTTITLDRLVNGGAEAQTVFNVTVRLNTFDSGVRAQPYSGEGDQTWFRWEYTNNGADRQQVFIPKAQIVARSLELSASIESATGDRVESYTNGRRYDSQSRAYKVAVFLDKAEEAAAELISKIGRTADRVEDLGRTYDRAAEEAAKAARESEFNARKIRSDWVNAQVDQANANAGAQSSYDSRRIADYSAEGLSAGRLDIRTANLTVDEVNAILAVLTGAGRRIASGPTAGSVNA
jgi:hypothetical protein